MINHGFPPEWSTLKKLIWLVGSGIAGAASGIWKTVTGALIHITDALASPMQKCEVTLEPIQSGSGNPSPTNVRPITGWTGCEVTRTGKNLIDLSKVVQGAFDGSQTATNCCIYDYFPIKSGSYVWHTDISNISGRYVLLYDSEKQQLNEISLYGMGDKTFTIPSTAYYFRVYWYRSGGITPADITSDQIELGSTATDYEPYSGTTLSVTFPDSAGTVYGGTVDLVSGVLTVDRIITSPPTSASPWYSGYGGWYYVDNRIYAKVGEKYKVKCNLFKTKLTPDATSGIYVDANVVYFQYVKSLLNISTLNEWLNYLQENTVEAVSPLKEPITYQLTPQPISTLKGENNVWSNSNGDTTIIYKAQAE